MIQTKNIDWYKTTFLILAITFAILWLRGCGASKTPQMVEVTVPEAKGKFAPQKPINTPIAKWSNSTTFKSQSNLPKNDKSYFNKSKKAIVQNEPIIVKSEIKSDSIVKAPCEYQLNNFSTKFENDDIVLNIEGVAEGTVKEITPSYIMKERKGLAEVKAKETVLRLLGGAELGLPTNSNIPLPIKANIMLQNLKGNIFTGSIDTNGTIWAGYNFSIFNFKR